MNLINILKNSIVESSKKPSSGLSKKEKSRIVKKAKKGEDFGKKGKNFEKIVDKAEKERYKDPKAVAGAVFWKNIQREGYDMEEPEEDHEVSMAMSSLRSIIQSAYELMEKLGNEERNIPGWIQDHITNSENYIDQAASGFHELDEDTPNSGSIEEKKLTKAEKSKKEDIVKSIAKKKGGKEELQPRDYAIATSQAIKSA